MKKIIYIVICVLFCVGCGTAKKTNVSPNHIVKYLSNDLDGSVTLRVSAIGKTKEEAIENAKKYAVREVIFDGVKGANSIMLTKPLIYSVNAEEKYQDFFNAFFATSGEYTNFVSTEDTKNRSNKFWNSSVYVRVEVTIKVLRYSLKQYLLNNNIIQP